MQEQSSMIDQGQGGYGGQYRGGQNWQGEKPGRALITQTFEVSDPRQAQQLAAAAISIPGVGFKTYPDQATGRTKVSLSFSRHAAQRINEVNQLQQRLVSLALEQR